MSFVEREGVKAVRRIDRMERIVLLLRMHRKKQQTFEPIEEVFVYERPSTPPLFERAAALGWPTVEERTDRRGEGGAPLRSGLPTREMLLGINKQIDFDKRKVEK